MAISEPRGRDLIDRYKANYGIPAEAPVSEDMILRHWDLERTLTSELVRSTPENRWEVFDHCYTTLYAELEWLNRWAGADPTHASVEAIADWASLVGEPPKRVYEVGSGKGDLVRYLAEMGHDCRATEITRERGERWVEPHANLSWGLSDGVHLDRFELPAAYDVVISDQVVEHLHPDDLTEHFRGVLAILAPGGRYIFSTPHRHHGPWDVSRIFNSDRPQGMHLKEYTYGEIVSALRRAGFARAYAPFTLPRRVRRPFGGRPRPAASRAYLLYLRVVEQVISLLPTQRLRRKVARAAKIVLFDGVTMVGEKPA